MSGLARYPRLLAAFAQFSLAREMAFRGNFLAKILVEVLWLSILLLFYRTIFAKTAHVAYWSEAEYLFFVGCYYALEGLIETFFLENLMGFAELVRTGELDFYLLQPIDEQFLISCKGIDWSTAPNFFLGVVVMILSYRMGGWALEPLQLVLFLLMFLAGVVLAYGFLLMLTSTSVWLIRNSSLLELWWLFTSLMRYPRDIFRNTWAAPIGFVFSFLIPVMLVVHVPASTMVKLLDGWICLYMLLCAAAILILSRWVLRLSLRHYRSASS